MTTAPACAARSAGRLAIAGAGITGAYLYRLLANQGREADIFERGSRTHCGLKPCAWGTSTDFIDLVRRAGLDPESYVTRRLDSIDMHGVRLPGAFLTFDKPRLVRDLLGDAQVLPAPVPVEEYERVIDATGADRALLPPIADDVTLECREYLVEVEEPIENRIQLGGIGYAWRFPLSPNLCHVGCGSLLADPGRILASLGWLRGQNGGARPRFHCGCVSKIRLTGPRRSRPFVANGHGPSIWGIGEAIGCVAPLVGDGIVPGMRSVELLLANWDDAEAYTRAVLAEFAWMEDERAIIDRLRRNDSLGLKDARVLKRNAKRMGMRVGLRQALTLLLRLR